MFEAKTFPHDSLRHNKFSILLNTISATKFHGNTTQEDTSRTIQQQQMKKLGYKMLTKYLIKIKNTCNKHFVLQATFETCSRHSNKTTKKIENKCALNKISAI